MENKSKTLTLTIIIVIALLLIAYLWYSTLPKNVAPSKVVVVPADLLDNEQAINLKKAPTFGNLPVSVSGAERSKPDPFAGI